MGIRYRLEKYKKRGERLEKDWRDVRWEKHSLPDRPIWSADRSEMYLDDFSIGEDLGPAHELIDLRHTGWFIDYLNHEDARGHVVKLRTRDGVLLIPAVTISDYDGVTYYMEAAVSLSKQQLDESEFGYYVGRVARDADRYAEHVADDCREEWVKDVAHEWLVEKREELHNAAVSSSRLRKALKSQISDLSIVILSAVTGYQKVLSDKICSLVTDIKKGTDDPMYCVSRKFAL
jgi:hypothetical protein